jgi:hypothetical protein
MTAENDTLRHMLIVTSNAYKDREQEIIKESALKAYVDTQWKDDEFVGNDPLLLWHAGDPIGEIVFADMKGPFLVEVARELPNQKVNLARDGDPPVIAEVKQLWDALEKERSKGASHEFTFRDADREDGIYEMISKHETSILPRKYASIRSTKR